MPIDLQHAEAMLTEDECPFTREQFEACKIDNTKPLFTWSGIDMFLLLNVKAKTR